MEPEQQGTPPEPTLSQPPQRRRSVVGPALLILLGVVFLLSNLGLVSWNIWELMWRLWPVWLVAAGLDMLLGRRTSLGGWLILAFTLALVGGAGWFVQALQNGGGAGPVESFHYPVQSAQRAEVVIRPGVAELQVRAGQPDVLAAGTAQPLLGGRIIQDCQCSGADARFTLEATDGSWNSFLGNHGPGPEWNVQLTPAIPLDVQVDTGVGMTELDLSALKVTTLDMNTGVGRTEVILPRQGQVTAEIDSGVGELVVLIPRSMAARVDVDSGIGHVAISGDFQQQGDRYISPDFETAANRVEITVDGGVGEIRIEEIE